MTPKKKIIDSESTPGPSMGAAPALAVIAIRDLIVHDELRPGDQLRQAELADRIGISRVPLREALKVLEAEGAIVHRPNQGYFVTKFSQDDLRQIYLMRGLLERELLRTIEWPSRDAPAELKKLNDEVASAAQRFDIAALSEANRRFHFAIFDWSPLNRVREEVERMWRLSEVYQTLYLYDQDAQKRIVTEHRRMIRAVRDRDHEQLIEIAAMHRSAAAEVVDRRLEPLRRRTPALID